MATENFSPLDSCHLPPGLFDGSLLSRWDKMQPTGSPDKPLIAASCDPYFDILK